jgi:putative addiction module killer protein
MAIKFSTTIEFSYWLSRLVDSKAKARILARIRSAEFGNFGDCKPVGDAVFEMRIHYGQGYRLYYTRTGSVIYVLLCGGEKSTQKADIMRAIALSKTLKGEYDE